MVDVEKGFPAGYTAVIKEADRRSAIRLALSQGQPGDVIVLAGKGHETYQEIGTERIHFDEREEIAAYFK
jgi:UDP-N-acetylmuramoyl-L-alanyl-D-glutamate--2,6-diaminopimelate ligase